MTSIIFFEKRLDRDDEDDMRQQGLEAAGNLLAETYNPTSGTKPTASEAIFKTITAFIENKSDWKRKVLFGPLGRDKKTYRIYGAVQITESGTVTNKIECSFRDVDNMGTDGSGKRGTITLVIENDSKRESGNNRRMIITLPGDNDAITANYLGQMAQDITGIADVSNASKYLLSSLVFRRCL